MIISKLKTHFESSHIDADNHHNNVWLMAVTLTPFKVKDSGGHCSKTLSSNPPTHIIRVVLRTTDLNGTNHYVDGTDLYLIINEKERQLDFVWEDLWAEGPPIFHGGTVPDALRWVRELGEPFYVQLKDPFLTPEQRIALNGHDEDYIEPVHEQRNEKQDARPLTDDDFDGYF